MLPKSIESWQAIEQYRHDNNAQVLKYPLCGWIA